MLVNHVVFCKYDVEQKICFRDQYFMKLQCKRSYQETFGVRLDQKVEILPSFYMYKSWIIIYHDLQICAVHQVDKQMNIQSIRLSPKSQVSMDLQLILILILRITFSHSFSTLPHSHEQCTDLIHIQVGMLKRRHRGYQNSCVFQYHRLG